jgi:1-acyl-sn-glycerol-3-phosphate acyltransferase
VTGAPGVQPTWYGPAPPPAPRRLGPRDWARVLRRGLPFALVTFGALGLSLLLRAVERPLFGGRRPVTAPLTRGVCVAAFWWMGLRRRVRGRPMRAPGLCVANHASWIDIFALNASDRVVFVAKEEVASWPGIGWLARATGTAFIRRARRDAGRQAEMLRARVAAGERLVVFPEGTSSDGLRVLPFRPALFAAATPPARVQPVTLRYTAPHGADPRVYGWWGDMGFAAHLVQVLSLPAQGTVEVIYHPPLDPGAHASRKALAGHAERIVRKGLG